MDTVIWIILGATALWLLGVSFFLFKSIKHYNTLVRTTDRKTLQSALEQLLAHAKESKTTISHLEKRIHELETSAEYTIQKVSLLRYNPFADTGGEQSFVIGLLDKHNSGMILTSLQGRSGTRWYAKRVKQSKGVDFDLSKEEEEAVKKAKPLT